MHLIAWSSGVFVAHGKDLGAVPGQDPFCAEFLIVRKALGMELGALPGFWAAYGAGKDTCTTYINKAKELAIEVAGSVFTFTTTKVKGVNMGVNHDGSWVVLASILNCS